MRCDKNIADKLLRKLYKPCRSEIEKNFIYERQKHIRFDSTLAQQAARL